MNLLRHLIICNLNIDKIFQRLLVKHSSKEYQSKRCAEKIILIYLERRKCSRTSKIKYKGSKPIIGSFLNKCNKIDETKMTLIKEFLKENKFKLCKLDNLRCYTEAKVGDSWTVSNSTFGRVIKTKFKMSFKKINKLNPILLTTVNLNKMLESVVIQLELERK